MNLEPSLRTTGTIASGQPSFTIAAPAIARVAATDALLASAALLAAATTVLVSSGPSPPGEETAAQKLDAACRLDSELERSPSRQLLALAVCRATLGCSERNVGGT